MLSFSHPYVYITILFKCQFLLTLDCSDGLLLILLIVKSNLPQYHSNPHSRDINTTSRTSLGVEWIGICLPLQGTQVWSLSWEDFTCHGQLKPTCHSDWACTLRPVSSTKKRSHRSEEPAHRNEEQPCALRPERACTEQPRPSTTKK